MVHRGSCVCVYISVLTSEKKLQELAFCIARSKQGSKWSFKIQKEEIGQEKKLSKKCIPVK